MNFTANKSGLYQRWLRKKFSQIEMEYYSVVDDLEQALERYDGHIVEPIDFTLENFQFVRDWDEGLTDTAAVVKIFENMDLEGAARAKLTKRLTNYMMKYDFLSELIKPVIAELNEECMVLMVEYLEMMKKFFHYLKRIDNSQINLTWVQQCFKNGGSIEIMCDSMSLNQSIRHIDSFLFETSDSFYFSDQVIVFNEPMGDDDSTLHWIFAPRQYIKLLKTLFNIKEHIGETEVAYLKSFIKDVVK